MKKIKVCEATNTQLDWLVAKCEQTAGFRDYVEIDPDFGVIEMPRRGGDMHVSLRFTTNWAQMGHIIEREKIDIYHSGGECAAAKWKDLPGGGQLVAKVRHCPTPLIAAARCYITLKLGDTAEVPEELAQ